MHKPSPWRPAAPAPRQPAAPAPARGAEPLGRGEWWLLTLAIWAVQGAFIPVASDFLNGPAEVDALGFPDPAASNPLNFTVMAATLAVLTLLALRRLGPLLQVLRHNPLIVLTTGLVIASIFWSFDPALSMRRAGTYSIGVLLALYLVARLSLPDIMKLIASSTLIPAVCSLIYALVDPSDAYMQAAELADSLRGVYSHKNELGNVMAIGFMAQCYLAVTTAERRRHLLLAGLHAFLVTRAHSAGSEISVIAVAGSLGCYYLWRKQPQVGAVVTVGAIALLAAGIWLAVTSPATMLDLIGRDVTLTGRTELWPRLWPAIDARLLSGWGYSAFWQVGNPAVIDIWEKVGWQPPHAHNGILEMTLDFGLMGLAASLLFLALFPINALRALRRGAGYEGWLYLAMWLYTLLNNMIEVTIMRVQEFAWLAFLILYMVCSARARGIALGTVTPESKRQSVIDRARPLAGASRSDATGSG